MAVTKVALVMQIFQCEQTTPELLSVASPQDEEAESIAIQPKTVQLVIIVLNARYYAFYGRLIQEILPVSEITSVPGMPTYLLGIMNVRGEIESVLDLRLLLGMPAALPTKRSRILMGEIDGLRSGILVDAVEDILELPARQLRPVASASRATCLAGEAEYQGQPLQLLDLAQLFHKLIETSEHSTLER